MSPLLIIFIHESHHINESQDGLRQDGFHEKRWTRIVIESLLRLLPSSGDLLASSLYTSSGQDLLHCTIDAPQESIPPFISKFKDKNKAISVQWRVYEPLKTPFYAKDVLTNVQHILVCNAMTPTTEREEDFNKWYNEEHILLLSRVPAWIQSMRYRLVDSSYEAPKYIGMHMWGSQEAFESPEYKFAITTPWRFRVVDKVVAKERHVYDFVREVRGDIVDSGTPSL